MSKLPRIVFGSILIVIGASTIIFGISLISSAHDWITYVFIGSLFITGIGVALGGWAIIRGAKIKDIIETIIISLQ